MDSTRAQPVELEHMSRNCLSVRNCRKSLYYLSGDDLTGNDSFSTRGSAISANESVVLMVSYADVLFL